jgi:hypothetical protein
MLADFAMGISQPKPDSVHDTDRARVEKTLDLVRTLLASLPEADRARFLRELTATIRPMSGPRAGEVLGAIVRLLPQRESWTVAELKQTIDERGIAATPREVYNAVSYLARKRHIRRIGYGRYLIDGVPVVTADQLGGQPSITEGGSDD